MVSLMELTAKHTAGHFMYVVYGLCIFLYGVTGGSAGRAGAPYTEAVPSPTGLIPPVATTPVSAPDQGTGKRSGVGPQVPYCSSPLLLACVVTMNYK